MMKERDTERKGTTVQDRCIEGERTTLCDRDSPSERTMDRTTLPERTKQGEWLRKYLNRQARKSARLLQLKSTIEQLKSYANNKSV